MEKKLYPIDYEVVQVLLDKNICVSRAEAKRYVMCLPPERIQKMIDRGSLVESTTHG